MPQQPSESVHANSSGQIARQKQGGRTSKILWGAPVLRGLFFCNVRNHRAEP